MTSNVWQNFKVSLIESSQYEGFVKLSEDVYILTDATAETWIISNSVFETCKNILRINSFFSLFIRNTLSSDFIDSHNDYVDKRLYNIELGKRLENVLAESIEANSTNLETREFSSFAEAVVHKLLDSDLTPDSRIECNHILENLNSLVHNFLT